MITLRKIENGFEIEFTGEHIPPPNNHLRISPKKINRQITSPEYREWMTVVHQEIKIQNRRLEIKLSGQMKSHATIYLGGRRLRTNADGANFDKATMDALVATELIPDDAMKYVVEWGGHSVQSGKHPFKKGAYVMRVEELPLGAGTPPSAKVEAPGAGRGGVTVHNVNHR